MKTTPHLFTPQIIRQVVEPDCIGVYVLGMEKSGHFHYRYIGRSDTDLQKRMLTHNYLDKLSYFIFQYVDTPREAFLLESKWWHDCVSRRIPLYNKVHPSAPKHIPCTCPYCHFIEEIRPYLQADELPVFKEKLAG